MSATRRRRRSGGRRSPPLGARARRSGRRSGRTEKDGAGMRRLGVAMGEIERLHHKVQRPKEQVADGEALLELVNALAVSAKSEKKDGPTPSQFVTSLLTKFGVRASIVDDSIESFSWSNLSVVASPLFMTATGCQTMNGPMNIAVKERKRVARRLFDRNPKRPAELYETKPDQNQRNGTDKNMIVMFKLLRKNQCVKLENLILNRQSFAQTVENIFALSFLVKDGRVEIDIDDNGNHFAIPRNAPAAELITSREVINSQYVFRFDTKDWEIMKGVVEPGDELMTNRQNKNGEYYYNNNTKPCSDSERQGKDDEFAKGEAMDETLVKPCAEDVIRKRRRSEAESLKHWFFSCGWE
uniref:Non-structural maintenance of chromosomes element 4 n=1 Tax=Leersia perrieri TaxID=77586 RepID=A0A0D9X9M8_9ORYZ